MKRRIIALAAAALFGLGACSQKSAEQAPPPATEAPPPVEQPSAEAPPPDLYAEAPGGQSGGKTFAGEAPPLPDSEAPTSGAEPPAPPPPSPPPPPPPVVAPSPSYPDPAGSGGPRDDYAEALDREKAAQEAAAAERDRQEYEARKAAEEAAKAAQNGAAPGSPAPRPPTATTQPRSSTSTGSASGSVIKKQSDGTTTVKVYFATDRKMEVKNNVRRFGADEVNGLYYGTVDVSIPPVHQVGMVESPQWWKMEFKPDPDKHVVYQGFDLLNRDSFYTSLSGLIAKSKEKEAFVFVHGFNTPFEEAARRTAQIEFDMKFDGAPIFYSWPSQGELSPFAYNRDAVSSDRTVPRLKYFLQEVSRRTQAKRVHLIAHSMGNKAMVNALVRVASEMSAADKPLFNQIVLTAPDIDREVFLDLAQQMRKAGSQVTLYASKNDKALQASKLYSGFPRAGDATGAPIVAPGIFTIDASAVTTDYFGLNHDFFADKKSVLTDVTALLRTGSTPDSRKLRKVKGADGKTYWVID